MWHVSSRSGVATLRTAIHLLLTYGTSITRIRVRFDLLAGNVHNTQMTQSCPWVGLTHGLGWVGFGWVHYSKSTKNLKGLR